MAFKKKKNLFFPKSIVFFPKVSKTIFPFLSVLDSTSRNHPLSPPALTLSPQHSFLLKSNPENLHLDCVVRLSVRVLEESQSNDFTLFILYFCFSFKKKKRKKKSKLLLSTHLLFISHQSVLFFFK
jgi:hypothetical protein